MHHHLMHFLACTEMGMPNWVLFICSRNSILKTLANRFPRSIDVCLFFCFLSRDNRAERGEIESVALREQTSLDKRIMFIPQKSSAASFKIPPLKPMNLNVGHSSEPNRTLDFSSINVGNTHKNRIYVVPIKAFRKPTRPISSPLSERSASSLNVKYTTRCLKMTSIRYRTPFGCFHMI